MKRKQCVKENTGNVQSQSSVVVMENVFQADGDAVNSQKVIKNLIKIK